VKGNLGYVLVLKEEEREGRIILISEKCDLDRRNMVTCHYIFSLSPFSF
jgi:hypothetical protein